MDELTMQLASIFETKIPDDINTIVWDLDCTLGACPGWDGVMDPTKYIEGDIAATLANLARANIRNVLVSNNSMFCEDHYDESASRFRALGFDDVVKCNRCTGRNKVFNVTRCVDCLSGVVLIDDQHAEVASAVNSGAHAIHVFEPVFTALTNNNFVVYSPSHSDEDGR